MPGLLAGVRPHARSYSTCMCFQRHLHMYVRTHCYIQTERQIYIHDRPPALVWQRWVELAPRIQSFLLPSLYPPSLAACLLGRLMRWQSRGMGWWVRVNQRGEEEWVREGGSSTAVAAAAAAAAVSVRTPSTYVRTYALLPLVLFLRCCCRSRSRRRRRYCGCCCCCCFNVRLDTG